MAEPALTRLLYALAAGLILVGVEFGVEAWLLHDLARAQPQLTRIGTALLLAAWVHEWLVRRATRKAAAR